MTDRKEPKIVVNLSLIYLFHGWARLVILIIDIW